MNHQFNLFFMMHFPKHGRDLTEIMSTELKLIVFVMLEHFLLLVAWLIHKAIPDRPTSVRIALARADYESKEALKREVFNQNFLFLCMLTFESFLTNAKKNGNFFFDKTNKQSFNNFFVFIITPVSGFWHKKFINKPFPNVFTFSGVKTERLYKPQGKLKLEFWNSIKVPLKQHWTLNRILVRFKTST